MEAKSLYIFYGSFYKETYIDMLKLKKTKKDTHFQSKDLMDKICVDIVL